MNNSVIAKKLKDMVEVTNKVVFLGKSGTGMNKENQVSSNIQGQLKKKIIKVEKLKIKEKITVLLTGTYQEFEVKIDPADNDHAPKIKALLKVKR